MTKISRTDINDSDFVDAVELASDGYSLYRSGTLVSTTAGSKTVLIDPADDLDILINVDEPVQVGDRIRIVGSTTADGYYTVASVVDNTSFTVSEDILTSTGGSVYYMHPAGATKVGIDTSGFDNSTSQNLQDVLQDLDTAISDGYGGGGTPDAECVGQVLYSTDGLVFQAALPITSNQGWLVNEQGLLLVGTCEDGYC